MIAMDEMETTTPPKSVPQRERDYSSFTRTAHV